jgi:tetratricopeptide (TPR) repeat protein
MDNSFDPYQKAREAMSKGKIQDAIELFQRSIQISPHFKSLELLGECLMKENRLTEAVVPLSAATSLNKGVRAPSLLSEVFYKLADFDNAKRFAAIALKRDPNNKKALKIKSLVKGRNGAG